MLLALKAHTSRRIVRRRGFSLIELAMVLAIIALMVAGVMLLFSNASSAQRTNDALTELAAVEQGVHTLYAGQSSYADITNNTLAASGQMPAKWTVGAGTGATNVDPFSGAVTIATGSGDVIPADESFQVTFAAVPNQACVKMSTVDLGNGLLERKVDGTGAQSGPLTPAEAAAQCNIPAGVHTITWEFS